MKKILISTLIFCLCSTAFGQLITSNVLQRVYLIKYGSKYGTAFTIEVDNKQYLITAKHNLPAIKAENVTIEMFQEKTWKKLEIKVVKIKNSKVDIIILAPPFQLSPVRPFHPTLDDVIVSQDLYFLGFPYMINFDDKGLNRKFPLPFIKKGILSALDISKKKGTILYIDGHNNPGFSGGPIVFWNTAKKQFHVGGVIQGYRAEKSKVYSQKGDTGLETYTNTGIIIGYSIDHAVEAIKRNPIGVEIIAK